MKKKIIIAVFFAAILALLPATSAVKTSLNKSNEGFEIPLSEEDEKELRFLILNEEKIVENELSNILTEDGKLKIDDLEEIYEEYVQTGDSSVIQSDSWDWILDRLGWVYFTLEYVVTIYNDAMAIYYEITQGTQVVQDWYQSVLDLRDAWQLFKQKPLNFNNIKNLLTSAIDLIYATINVIEYISSQEIINHLNALITDVEAFVAFLQNDPWNEPIIIYGNVTGVDESVTISVKSDSETTMDEYSLVYTTSDAALSWFVHKCEITSEYKDKSFTKNKFAFSMGKIEFNIDEEDFKAKSKDTENLIFFDNFEFLRLFDFLNLKLLTNILLKFQV